MREKNRGRTSDQGQAIDLTPMLDVVFIMLIFFIVTASFIKTPGEEVNKPGAKSAVNMATSVLVAITKDGDVWIDKQKVSDSEIKLNITRLHAENPKGALIIQADSESALEKVGLVADAAKQVGISRVAVSTTED